MSKEWTEKEMIEAIIIDRLIENGFINAADIDGIDNMDSYFVGVNVSSGISYGSYADFQQGTDIEDAAYMVAYGDALTVWKYCQWKNEDILLY